MKIVYLLDCFPKLSETFILNEIVELKKIDNSIGLSIYSLKKPKENLVHKQAKQFSPIYINDLKISFFKIFFYFLEKVFTHPLGVVKSVFFFTVTKKGNLFKYYLFNLWCFLFRLLKISYSIEKEGCNHIHSHFALISTQYTLCVHLLTKIPYSFTSHANDIFVNPQLLKQKHKHASFAVTISEFNKKYLIDNFNVKPEKINVIHCGINTNMFNNKKHHDMRQTTFNIVSIGRFVQKKGFPYLIKACKLFKDKYGEKFQCSIIGAGELQNSLKKLIDEYKLADQIKLTGEKTQSEVIDILTTCDTFVLPCIKADNGDMDGSPMVIKEAMAMGVTTISTTISGIPEIILDGTGFLVPPESETELFNAIEKVYLMPPNVKHELEKKAKELIEVKFNVNSEAKKLLSLLKNYN